MILFKERGRTNSPAGYMTSVATFSRTSSARWMHWGLLTCVATLCACGTIDSASNSVLSVVTPYRPEIVQGNVVTSEQVALLKPGLSKLQVRQLLGTPLVNSVFHADRWDYVFTINRQGTEPQKRNLTLLFTGERLDKFVGDTMPSETAFIASISKAPESDKPVKLEASAEELAKFAPSTTPAPAPVSAPNVSYPPLESGAGR
jgi:outer membrane protein assembly factor BamE